MSLIEVPVLSLEELAMSRDVAEDFGPPLIFTLIMTGKRKFVRR